MEQGRDDCESDEEGGLEGKEWGLEGCQRVGGGEV